ncbi:Putative NAD-dependent epimerase/dehydratase, maoC-like dehydratase domain, Hydrophobin superfamily [Septoria linicola]|uniref:NAD-dependent epimerase/dehydratase, maoC-like dehydratase domain, Hydrophobin superfamily n=1 Tax=Septoria linicola TaxID=215465 RepID=A0A9Q9AUE7_9PEZI|nr:Putative NAD-dependent epimerase/dehydratase, maoC-like dehydratase domain, Hydrophobin superfamily [Septoria linicola]
MQFQLFAFAFAALAAAAPGAAPGYTSTNGDKPLANAPKGSAAVCTSGWTPSCCATNVLGVAGLECSAVPKTITSKDNFKRQCSKQGLSDNCCLIPIISAVDVTALVLKAILKAIPGYSNSLKPGHPGSQTFQLPAIRTEGILRIDDDNVASFINALRTRPDGSATTTSFNQADVINPFFLVASTVPLTITILTHRSCPIKPLGAVNTRNQIRFLDPGFCRSINTIKAAADASQLSYGASFGGEESPGRRSKRGIEFCITIELFTPDAVVLRQECSFMQPLPKHTQPKWDGSEAEASESADSFTENGNSSGDTFQMSPQDPLRWAATSKDYNPIHVWKTGAKLFGFSNVIAHGNHVGALAVERLRGSQSGQAYQMCWESDKAFSISLKFTRPMILPATADTEWQASKAEGSVSFIVKRAEKLLSHGYSIRGTARDESKLNAALNVLRKRHPEAQIEGVIVKDMTAEGAFDEAMAGVAGVMHVASDMSFGSDPKVVVGGAVAGVVNALRAAAKTPSVKRVVYTSSSIATTRATSNKKFHIDTSSWNDADADLVKDPNANRNDPYWPSNVYGASKVESERAGWAFVKEHQPQFTFNTVNPNLVLGPILLPPGSTGGMVQAIRDGDEEKANMIKHLPPQYMVHNKDVALLHLAALLESDVNNERLLAFAEPFTYGSIIKTFAKIDPSWSHPEIPENEPQDLSTVDTSRAEELLKRYGRNGFAGLEETLREQLAFKP